MKNGKKAIINSVIGAVVAVILLMFGFFCFFPAMEPDYETVFRYEAVMNVSLPEEGELTEFTSDTYFSECITNMTKTDAYFNNPKEFEYEIMESEMWISDSDLRKTDLSTCLPMTMMNWENVRYLIYNETTGEYNCLPVKEGKYRMCVMMYEATENHLEINEYDYAYVQ